MSFVAPAVVCVQIFDEDGVSQNLRLVHLAWLPGIPVIRVDPGGVPRAAFICP